MCVAFSRAGKFHPVVLAGVLATVLLPSVTDRACGQFAADLTAVGDTLKVGFDSITPEQAEEWVGVLAGPQFAGRGTGQVGYTQAAHWVAGKIAEFGLKPVGTDGTYFQMLPMQRRTLDLGQCWLSGPGGQKIEAEGNLGFERFTDELESTGDVVFVNFSDPNKRLPTELSLRNKVVIFRSAPGVVSAPVQLAAKRPLAAIRVIEGQPQSLSQVSHRRNRRNTSISGTISIAAAQQLAKACAVDPAVVLLSQQLGDVVVQETGQQVTLHLRHRVQPAAVPNVVGWLEGSDPALRNEYVVIGSHLDHLGIRGGQIYPGADDNASGSTAVLSIAKALTDNPIRPKRSVLFIWFAAEEIGLVGSKYFCDNPTIPTDNMICMLNIDMVGRNEETKDESAAENEGHIHLVGSQKGETDLHQLIYRANESIGFKFEFDEEQRVFSRSDQINFYKLGVPVAFLFGGFHPDYHQPSDQPTKINFQKVSAAAKLYYLAIHLASDHGRFKLTQKQSAAPNSK